MKYLILFLFGCLIAFASCKKCAECTTTVTIKSTGQQPQTATSRGEYCGDELDEADGYYNVATSTVNGYTATITTSTTCN